jgi:hypothetical protein
VFLIACGSATPPTVSPSPSAGGASPGQGEKGAAPKKNVADLIKGSRKYEGLFTIYQDTATGSTQIGVRKDQLGKEFIYNAIVDEGVSPPAFWGGRTELRLPVNRRFNKIEFVIRNTSFYFDPASPLRRAAEANISPSVIAAVEIAGEDTTSGEILIKSDDLFLAEAFRQVKPTPDPNARPGPSFQLGTLSKTKTRITSIRSYPLNSDVIVEYVYEYPAPVVRGGQDVTDARNVSVRVLHSSFRCRLTGTSSVRRSARRLLHRIGHGPNLGQRHAVPRPDQPVGPPEEGSLRGALGASGADRVVDREHHARGVASGHQGGCPPLE